VIVETRTQIFISEGYNTGAIFAYQKSGVEKPVFDALCYDQLQFLECVLASPAAAMGYCSKMGKWDISKIKGRGYQYGSGYGCKQGIETGGTGHALCK